VRMNIRVGQNRVYNNYDNIFSDSPAKNKTFTPFIYGWPTLEILYMYTETREADLFRRRREGKRRQIFKAYNKKVYNY